MLKYQNELKANHIDLDPIRDNEVINHFKKLVKVGEWGPTFTFTKKLSQLKPIACLFG